MQAGDWFPAGLSEKDFRGLFGYKVFLAMAIFIGDGLYNLFKVTPLSDQGKGFKTCLGPYEPPPGKQLRSGAGIS